MQPEQKQEEIKTKFQGPGEWRSQAKKLESDGQTSPEDNPD